MPKQRLRSGTSSLLALAVLVFILWSGLQVFGYPYDGIARISSTGEVMQLDPGSPAAAVFQPGDQILLVNDVAFNEAIPFYRDYGPGESVSFLVKRGAQTYNIGFELERSSPWEIMLRLAPLVLALTFWVIGVLLIAFNPVRERGSQSIFFFLSSAALLSAGVNSYVGPQWAAGLFFVFFWLIGPLAVHFHLQFPQEIHFRQRRWLIGTLYTISLLGGSPYLLLGLQRLRLLSWYNTLVFSSQIFLALNFFLVVGILFYAYQNATSAGTRAKIRLVVLGGALSLLPLVTLMLLPDALVGEAVVPYAFFPLFLAFLPITYAYAIFRQRLIEIERHVNRGATAILVYSILGGIYLVLNLGLAVLLPAALISKPALNTLLVLVLVSIFVPLQRVLARVVDTVFYGGWYDYRSAITKMSQGMEQVTDLMQLAELTSERLVRILRLEEGCVFFSDLRGNYSIVSVAPQPLQRDASNYTPLPRSSLNYLLQVGGSVERAELQEALSKITLSPEEDELLNSPQAHLWVPIVGHGRLLGLLALGPKFGGDEFSTEDLDILRILARQLSPLIENIHLVTQLRQHADELEQRVAERTAELHSAKERSEAILASVGEGVIVTDLEGRIQTVNEAYERQSGYAAQELLGKTIWSFYEIEDQSDIQDQVKASLEEHLTWNREQTGRRRNGVRYDVQLTLSPLRTPTGEIFGYVGSQRDITRQKELDRLKDLFVSDVSHELRTPTTNIGLYLELLEAASPDRQPGYLQVLKEQTQLLIKLVEDILDLSRLASGKVRQVEYSDINFNHLVQEVVTAHIPLASSSGLALKFQPSEGEPMVRGEPSQLARVVTNLVYNALNYTLSGGVAVRVEQRDNQVCLDVLDTGIGIDEEDLPHIFERFYRGRRVRQTKKHGTGLGLAIVKEIVDLHGGMVRISSEVGRGSSFTVELPAMEAQEWPEKSF